jgi:hypothetical protein
MVKVYDVDTFCLPGYSIHAHAHGKCPHDMLKTYVDIVNVQQGMVKISMYMPQVS